LSFFFTIVVRTFLCVCVCVEKGAHARWKSAQERIAHRFPCKVSVLFSRF